MPTYEYECMDCCVRFERRQKITDEPISVCPKCGGATRRVLHPVGIIFKGSGFYCTDNRRNGGTQKSEPSYKTDESEPSEAKSGDSKSSEAKTGETGSEKAAGKTTAGTASPSS